MDSENDILERNKRKLFKLKNVEGVGVGYKIKDGVRTEQTAAVVFVREKMPASQLRSSDLVPQQIEGIQTDVIETGRFRLLSSYPGRPGYEQESDDALENRKRTSRLRPAPGGVSIGHYEITAGTLGAIVTDNAAGQKMILSNNHVLANLSTTTTARAKIGDPILQPGPYDNGSKDKDILARLYKYIPLETTESGITCPYANFFETLLNTLIKLIGKRDYQVKFLKEGKENLIDAALAEPEDEEWIERKILEIGEVKETAVAELGTKVKKSGRTTGITEGEVTAIGSSVKVDMGHNQQGVFGNQIVTTPLSKGGDSGSLVVNDKNQAVGLLFAGSENNTVFNPIHTVMALLDISI
ncbi:MAG: hypothetical protein UMV23_02000 [Halanaerobium sp.]|nr:hypothetical protein [Halanaerobium sp.]